jgi:hypothetical protein
MFVTFSATSMALRHAVRLDRYTQDFFRKLPDSFRSFRRECWIRSESPQRRSLKEDEVKQNERLGGPAKSIGSAPLLEGRTEKPSSSTPAVWVREGGSIVLSVRW